VAVRGDPDAIVFGVPGDGLGDVAGSELGEGVSFAGVVLAYVLGQDVDLAPVAVEDGPEGPARADGVELAVVTPP